MCKGLFVTGGQWDVFVWVCLLQVVYEMCTGLKAYDSKRKNEERLVCWQIPC